MNQDRKRFAATLATLALAVLAAGCFGDDEKPRPDFMSKSKGSETTATPDRPSEPPGVAPASPSATDDRVASVREPRSLTPAGEPRNEADPRLADDSAWEAADEEFPFDEEAPETDDEEEEFAAVDEHVEEQDEEEEEPTVMLRGFPVRVPRPLPVDDLPAVTAAPTNEPTPSQLVKATAKWEAKPQSEIERLLLEERAADLKDIEVEQLPDYFAIPVPPNPEAD